MSELNHEMNLKESAKTKVDPAAMATSAAVETGNVDNRYWLSLEQWSNDPKFKEIAEQEFMSSPLREDKEEGWARREFLKLMGASLAMASAGCIRRPVQKIVPYVKAPEDMTIGVAGQYTSSYFDGSESVGLLVRTREGRPIKIEGNPLHPLTKGGTSVRAQAHILSLYDPERIKGPKKNLQNKEKTNRETIDAKWEDVDAAVVKQLAKGSVAVLTGSMASPSTKSLSEEFAKAFGGSIVHWNALTPEDVREGQQLCYGEDLVPAYRFDEAKVIVSVDADFLGTWINPTAFTKQYSLGRKDIKNMSKLIAFDSNYSLTGANADIRVRIKPSQQLSIVMGLLHEILVKKSFGKYASDSKVKSMLESYANVAETLAANKVMEKELFAQIAEDLIANKGKSLVVAGGMTTWTESSRSLQVAVNFLNSVLENDGKTIESKSAYVGMNGSYSEMLDLIEKMKKGAIKTIVIHGVNPVYALPSSLGFVDALKSVEMVIYTGDRVDETGKQADYVLPTGHVMENWGDVEFVKGLYGVQQPTIRPLYDTRSMEAGIITWLKASNKASKRVSSSEGHYEYLRAFWKEEIYPKAGAGKSFDDFWDEALQSGFAQGAKVESSARTFRMESLSKITKPTDKDGMQLVLYPTIQLGDGTLANVSWLQELPDPITKICWDNYASVSLANAEKWKIKEGYMLAITVDGKQYELPAHIQPGLHDDVVAVAVGYGRSAAGKVANGVGQNAFTMATVKNNEVIFSGQSVTVKPTGKKYDLANPQGHHYLGDSQTQGRKIVVEATLKEYLKDPAANNHNHKIWSIWSGHQYNGNKWGMAIDMNQCTGCNACVVSCQSENNVPVVGKKYVIDGREMHWIRIDRYFVGDPVDAQVVFQPLMCQHCDNAPCETVCPVAATVHSDDGLNDMVYNRCVGTRYCANNCPYKVRRFNWFDNIAKVEKPLHLAHNPDVTVRMRGVMEKCSFCVHRIKDARITAKNDGRTLKDGDVKTACQTACPTEAIVFGDVNDPSSKVSKMFKEDPRAYALLEEFHAAPSVRYLTKIRNNNKDSLRPDQNGSGSHNKGGHA